MTTTNNFNIIPMNTLIHSIRRISALPFAFCLLNFAPRPLLLALCLLVALSSCNKTETAQSEAAVTETAPTELKLTAEQEKNFGISLGNPETRTVFDAIVLNGVVELSPQQSASVSFPLSGIVRSIGVLAGNSVGKGSTLATIESLEIIQLQEDYWKNSRATSIC